jgi:hypothetical protein
MEQRKLIGGELDTAGPLIEKSLQTVRHAFPDLLEAFGRDREKEEDVRPSGVEPVEPEFPDVQLFTEFTIRRSQKFN